MADTAVSKEVDVVIIRKGAEETRKVTLRRPLEDSEKAQQESLAKAKEDLAEKPVTQGGSRSGSSGAGKDLRGKQDQGKRQGRGHHRRRRRVGYASGTAGDVIVEVAQEAVSKTTPASSASTSSRRTARSRCYWSPMATANCASSR